MTSPRADVLVKAGAVEAVEFLGQGAGALSVLLVFNCLHLLKALSVLRQFLLLFLLQGFLLALSSSVFLIPHVFLSHHKAQS